MRPYSSALAAFWLLSVQFIPSELVLSPAGSLPVGLALCSGVILLTSWGGSFGRPFSLRARAAPSGRLALLHVRLSRVSLALTGPLGAAGCAGRSGAADRPPHACGCSGKRARPSGRSHASFSTGGREETTRGRFPRVGFRPRMGFGETSVSLTWVFDSFPCSAARLIWSFPPRSSGGASGGGSICTRALALVPARSSIRAPAIRPLLDLTYR